MPKGSEIISTAPGSPADKALQGGSPWSGNSATITLAGKPYVRYLGPYPTKAAAQHAAPEAGLQYVGTLVGIALGAADQGLTGAPGPAGVAAAGAAGGAAANGWSALVSGFSGTNFIVRAAKVIIGGTLLIIGLSHMSGADNALANAARRAPLPI